MISYYFIRYTRCKSGRGINRVREGIIRQNHKNKVDF